MTVRMNVYKPIIERYGEDIPINPDRKDAADKVCRYLSSRNSKYLQEYYDAVEYLLKQRDSERILLYLPFGELADAPKKFVDAYMGAWWHLTNVYDAAENFHEGDTFEVDARPDGKLERVVKCAHLIPWLIRSKYISGVGLVNIFDDRRDEILIQSIRDTFGYIRDHDLLSRDIILDLEAAAWGIPPRKKYSPLYISKKREEWLNERNGAPGKLVTPGAHLEGPFFPNIESTYLTDIISHIEPFPKPDDIILIGGSRLKGYGVDTSDTDLWILDELDNNPEMHPGSPNAAHIYFNTIWVSELDKNTIDDDINWIIRLYNDANVRKQSLERLESDLLQYRLLHKGFSRFTGLKVFETSPYIEMNGDCPFYDDEYRRIATMLYAKYVQIPESRSTRSTSIKTAFDRAAQSLSMGLVDFKK